MVKMLAALGGFFAEHPAPLLAGIRAQLARQPAVPRAAGAGPDTGGAHPPGRAPAEGHAGQLFARLAPLIALRTLPAAALEAPAAAGCLYGSAEAAVAHPGGERQAPAGSGAPAPAAGADAATTHGGSMSGRAADAQAAPGSDRCNSSPMTDASRASCGASSAAWQQRPQPGSIAAVLLQRMASAREMPEVRRQAAELMGRMAAPGAERSVVGLVAGGATSGDTLALRAGLFATCAALSARGARALALRDGGTLSGVLRAIAGVLRWSPVRAVPHLLHGCARVRAVIAPAMLLLRQRRSAWSLRMIASPTRVCLLTWRHCAKGRLHAPAGHRVDACGQRRCAQGAAGLRGLPGCACQRAA